MEKAFDAVQWMRKRRIEIDEEDRDLTWSEKRRKTHEIVMGDPLLALLCRRIMLPEQMGPMMVKESSQAYGVGNTKDGKGLD